jgi:hypothetical protein
MTAPTRFTRDGSPALEARLASICHAIRDAVSRVIPPHRLEALALGGGYGRGEGGVLATPAGDAPYNDIECFVFIRGSILLNERRFRKTLHHEAEALSELAGIEVEFKILSLARLRQSPPSMFYYDLVMGHRWLIGDDSLLADCEHHRDPTRIPPHEATRLLFNRCSGLLYARQRLEQSTFSDADADFVNRNLFKARLALGDAWLAATGRYHWSCLARHQALANSSDPWARLLLSQHRSGVAFKLLPQLCHAADRDRLQIEHTQLTDLARQLWLYIEGLRLGLRFASISDYTRFAGHLCPEHPSLRNAAINLRTFGPRGLLSPFATRYPRERLFRALALMLWCPQDDHTAPCLASCLNTTPSSSPRAYERLWHRFN